LEYFAAFENILAKNLKVWEMSISNEVVKFKIRKESKKLKLKIMKKLFLGVGLVAATMSFAQTFGVKGGMNVSSISKDGGLSDTKSKIGFNAGVFMNAPISEEFSIQPEVIYNDLGSKVKYTLNGANNNVEYSTNLGYIAVPVMFQYNATPAFYVEAGPEFGFLVNAKSKIKSGDSSASYDLDTDNFNTFNAGLGLGAGYYFTPNLGLTARYTAGLTKIGKDNTAYSDSKNNVFQVGLAYKFK